MEIDGIKAIPASSALAGTALSRQGKGLTHQADKHRTLNGEP